MRIKIFSYIVILTVMFSCTVNKNIGGKYRSNFADLGFFMTEINLKPDQSFHYVFSGDMQHTELDGKYKILHNRLYLRFDKLKDTTAPADNDTIGDLSNWQNTHLYDLKAENGLEFHLKYQIKGDKLHPYHIANERIVRRGKFYTDKKRYILFGPTIYRKRWYLKKVS